MLLTPRRCTDDHSASVAELMTNNDDPVPAKLQGEGEFDGRRIIYHFIHTIYPYMEACTLAMRPQVLVSNESVCNREDIWMFLAAWTGDENYPEKL